MNIFTQLLMTRSVEKGGLPPQGQKFAHLGIEAKAFARNQRNSYINRWKRKGQDKGFGKLYFATNLVPVTAKEVKEEKNQAV